GGAGPRGERSVAAGARALEEGERGGLLGGGAGSERRRALAEERGEGEPGALVGGAVVRSPDEVPDLRGRHRGEHEHERERERERSETARGPRRRGRSGAREDALEVLGEGERRRMAERGVAGERAEADLVERRRDAGAA